MLINGFMEFFFLFISSGLFSNFDNINLHGTYAADHFFYELFAVVISEFSLFSLIISFTALLMAMQISPSMNEVL